MAPKAIPPLPPPAPRFPNSAQARGIEPPPPVPKDIGTWNVCTGNCGFMSTGLPYRLEQASARPASEAVDIARVCCHGCRKKPGTHSAHCQSLTGDTVCDMKATNLPPEVIARLGNMQGALMPVEAERLVR